MTNFCFSGGDSLSKIGHDFSNKVVKKLKLSINYFYKKCAPKQLLFIEKKSDDFWHRKCPKLALFDEVSTDGDTNFGNFIWLQLIFGQKPCFLGPRQLVKLNIHYLSWLISMKWSDEHCCCFKVSSSWSITSVGSILASELVWKRL